MGVVVHRDERIGCKHHDLLNSSNSFTALFRLPFAPIGQSPSRKHHESNATCCFFFNLQRDGEQQLGYADSCHGGGESRLANCCSPSRWKLKKKQQVAFDSWCFLLGDRCRCDSSLTPLWTLWAYLTQPHLIIHVSGWWEELTRRSPVEETNGDILTTTYLSNAMQGHNGGFGGGCLIQPYGLACLVFGRAIPFYTADRGHRFKLVSTVDPTRRQILDASRVRN